MATIGNFHTHTLCFDGRVTCEEMITFAKKLGFDFLALTDHRFCKIEGLASSKKHEGGYDDKVCQEIWEKCSNEKRLFYVFPSKK